jgi:hypothetical protein
MVAGDLILFPGPEHYSPSQKIGRAVERYKLWGKCVVYDFSDGDRIVDYLLKRCRMYVKRSMEPSLEVERVGAARLLHLPYGALYEYVTPDVHEIPKDFDISFTMTPDPNSPTQASRLAAYNSLLPLSNKDEFADLNLIVGQDTHGGRRAILDEADESSNSFRKYMDTLNRSKIIVTVQPDHLGGDSRLWEAFLSGAVVVSNDLSGQRLGLRNGVHYVAFNPYMPTSELSRLLLDLLNDDERRERIAQAGRDYVLRHHMPQNRIDRILNAIS